MFIDSRNQATGRWQIASVFHQKWHVASLTLGINVPKKKEDKTVYQSSLYKNPHKNKTILNNNNKNKSSISFILGQFLF